MTADELRISNWSSDVCSSDLPDGNLATYADYEAFLARQETLAHILSAPQIRLHAHDGRSWQIEPSDRRPLTDLPVVFWVQLGVGLIAWLISGAIWIFRRSARSARYLQIGRASCRARVCPHV